MSETVSIYVGNSKSSTDGDDVVVTGGHTISGWENVDITCRCDGFPNLFALGTSARDPITRATERGVPGDLCWVTIGDDRVVTGYLDERVLGFGPDQHALSLTGRGKTQDLVDCSAEWPSGQMISGDAVSIAERLAEPYGIEVQLANGASAGPQVPQWALEYTETGAAIIERLAQNAGLLAYEDAHGTLLLAGVGSRRAASGILAGPGGNVESGSAALSMHERFSDVVCCWTPSATLNDLPGVDFFDTENDPNVLRHRQKNIILEAVGGDERADDFTKRRARWEVTRRFGRSTVIEVTVDSWRDKDGGLWTPNTLVPAQVPGLTLSGPPLLVSARFRRDKTGTHADLVLMPREAFDIEPISLQPIAAADINLQGDAK